MARLASYVSAHPITSIATVVGLLGSTGAAIAQRDNLALIWDNIFWATPHYARVTATAPIRAVQHEQGIYLDSILLKGDREALKDAQAELKEHPDSRTAPLMIEHLQKAITDRVSRLDKASRYGAE